MKNARVGTVSGRRLGLHFLWALVENPEEENNENSGVGDRSIPDCKQRGVAEKTSAGVGHCFSVDVASAAWWHKRIAYLMQVVDLIRHHGINHNNFDRISENAAAPTVPELLIIVTGCCTKVATGTGPMLVTNTIDGFEVHEFAAIRQRIQESYQSDIVTLARRYECMDDTVIMNLMIDSFGKVEAAVLQPGADEHPMFNRELESTARQWSFPAILRHGACSVVVSGHQFGQRAIDGNGDL